MRKVRSSYCIHMTVYPATRYEPAECYCEYGEDDEYDCENCPHRYSKEDAEMEAADLAYARYRDEVDFGI